MNLRPRLTLTVLALSLPIAGGGAWLRAELDRDAVEQGLREFALARMEAGDRERCEADPSRFPLPAAVLIANRPPLEWLDGGPDGGESERDLAPEVEDAAATREDLGAREGADPSDDDGGRPGRGLGDEFGRPPRDGPRDAEPPGARPFRGPGGSPRGGRGFDRRGPRPSEFDRERAELEWRRGELERAGVDRPPFDPDLVPQRGAARPGRRAGIELFAYRADFSCDNPGVPALPEELRAPLAAGADEASRDVALREGYLFQYVFRTEWSDGPCAVLYVHRRSPDAVWRPATYLRGAVVIVLLVSIVVLAAAGPIVARVRRLTVQVRASAARDYDLPIVDDGADELGELGRAFDEAAGEVRANLVALAEREERLRRFVENTTHDVAIPLTVLQGHLSTLSPQARAARGEGELDPASAAEHLSAMIQESHYIASILANLGVAARLESSEQPLERAPVDLGALVERVALRHKMIGRERDLRVEFSLPEESVIVSGDVTLLEQAIGNVVHNAIRHGHDGGNVAIVLSAFTDRFELRILDDGPGIPEADRERLLERESRGNEARTRTPDGRGLGLHIAHEVVTLHAFELALDTSEAGGLEVCVRGPRQTA